MVKMLTTSTLPQVPTPRTHFKCHDVLAPTAVDFTGATGTIRVEIVEYNSAEPTIPAGLNLAGYVGLNTFPANHVSSVLAV